MEGLVHQGPLANRVCVYNDFEEIVETFNDLGLDLYRIQNRYITFKY